MKKGQVKIYRAVRMGDEVSVTVDGKPLPLRLDLRNHSPTGFEWGYLGSGPAQLALAILADAFDDEFAVRHYQRFKEQKIASQQNDRWQLALGERERMWIAGGADEK